MYGFFIHAFEKFITAKYGKERWHVIRVEAGVFEDNFDDTMAYDDNMVIEIMDAACELLDVEVFDLQREFGEAYFDNCLHSKHGTLLKKLGGNLYDFLTNIDSLHDHLGVSYPGVKLPSFRVKQEIGRRISVNYYSDRDELEYIVPGVIKRAAKALFDIDVQATIPISESKTIIVSTVNNINIDRMFPKEIETSRDLIPHANEPKVSPLEFTKVFPFHMVFDRNMMLKQIGTALCRILPDINLTKDALITSFFTLSRPQIYFTFDSIYSRLNNIFILSVNRKTNTASYYGTGNDLNGNHQTLGNKQGQRKALLRLKGEMVYLKEKELMLFLCSPLVTTIQDMRNKGLCLNDIPVHDATRDLVLLCDNVHKEMELAQQLNIVSDHLKKIHGELEEHLILYNRLLYAVLPTTIAQRLGEGKSVPTERFLSATLMFSGIVDFATVCSGCEPTAVVHMLNDLYTKFDGLVSYLQDFAYKVETVGDKYMTASGVPEKVSNHPAIICSLALDMHDLVKEMTFNGKGISVTFGIHSGEIVAGVIGHKMPRYCLFGNTVNLTSRTETTGVPGKINVTGDTYDLLDHTGENLSAFRFEERGLVKMKGKSDPMKTYLLRRWKSRENPMQHGFLHSNHDDVTKSYGPGNEYISLYRNLRHEASSIGGRKSRNLSKFSTPANSRPTSIMSTPGFSSRCGSGIFDVGLANSLYEGNNNILEVLEVPSLSTSMRKDAISNKAMHWSNEGMWNTDESTDVKTPRISSSMAPDLPVNDVTKMLNEINELIQKDNWKN